MELIITDGATLFSEEKRDAGSVVRWLADGVPPFGLINSSRDGRYRIEKQILTDPHRSALAVAQGTARIVSAATCRSGSGVIGTLHAATWRVCVISRGGRAHRKCFALFSDSYDNVCASSTRLRLAHAFMATRAGTRAHHGTVSVRGELGVGSAFTQGLCGLGITGARSLRATQPSRPCVSRMSAKP
jgi:hypothetical protein